MQALIKFYILILLLSSCGAKLQTNAIDPNFVRSNVVVNWTANRERAVNSAGGGYVVTYSQDPNASYANAEKVTVNYSSGPTAPTTVTLSIPPGTFYIKVYAFSALNPPGSNSGSLSPPSVASVITLP